MSHRLLVGLWLVAVALAGCGGEAGLPLVSDARIGRPTGSNGALYFTVRGQGAEDRLVAARTQVAESVEIHETVIGSDGTATMRPIADLDLPARGGLNLEPGGLHLMLVEVDRLEVGAVVEVVLVWENAGEMTIEANVVQPSETIGDHDHG